MTLPPRHHSSFANPIEPIVRTVLLLRGHKVMLDFVLARLYGIEAKTLNQAVRRNLNRFPEDFMFQLTEKEVNELRPQILAFINTGQWQQPRSKVVALKRGEHIHYRPFAFTELGVVMLSSVLRNRRAVQVNIEILRLFARLHQIVESRIEPAYKLAELESKYNKECKIVFDALRELTESPETRKRPIGFAPWPREVVIQKENESIK
jgi:hypothetical protein